MNTVSSSPKKSRKKVGPGGPKHWQATRAEQKATTRSRISATILSLECFPTRAAVISAGKGSFSASSVDRHIDLIDDGQIKANAALLAEGLTPQPLRISNRRGAGRDQRLDEERARSADLAERLEKAERKVDQKDMRIADLEERISRLEKVEAARRRAQRESGLA